MNYTNFSVIISTFILAVLFFACVFININIREEKRDLDKMKDKISSLELKIKRQKIEITTLTNPKYIINYIDKYNLKPVGLKSIDTIVIKND